MRNGCSKPYCVGKPIRPPFPLPAPCPKSVTTCPKGQERVLKDSPFETSDQRRNRRRLGLAKARAAKGGKVSAKARRKLLSESIRKVSPARCPPVYVCVPIKKPKCTRCSFVVCSHRLPRNHRQQNHKCQKRNQRRHSPSTPSL